MWNISGTSEMQRQKLTRPASLSLNRLLMPDLAGRRC